MRTIVFATANPGKVREAQEILGEAFRLVTPAEMGITEDIPETGSTLQENSLQKAEYIYEHCGCDCFADDTGLEVDILGGAPGVHTARYGGAGRDFNANMDKLLSEMQRKEEEIAAAQEISGQAGIAPRTARFRTSVTLILDGQKYFFDGIMEGTIARTKAGCGGFGYDPVFQPEGKGGLTAAEISEEEKNAISHRGKALRAMAAFLKEYDREAE
jgi:XTP/dITP diphosphohydrolase